MPASFSGADHAVKWSSDPEPRTMRAYRLERSLIFEVNLAPRSPHQLGDTTHLGEKRQHLDAESSRPLAVTFSAA